MARTPAPRYLGSRVREIGEITAGLKRLARAEDVCVALLTQLNQAVDAKDRTDRRPNLADLGDSGEIEQDADAALMLYREVLPPGARAEGFLRRSRDRRAPD
jgi:replicative DNA helicase